MQVRFVLPDGGFFDRETDAVPQRDDTVRHHEDADGRLVFPQLMWVREVVWDTFAPPGAPNLKVEVLLTNERPKHAR